MIYDCFVLLSSYSKEREKIFYENHRRTTVLCRKQHTITIKREGFVIEKSCLSYSFFLYRQIIAHLLFCRYYVRVSGIRLIINQIE